MNIKHIFESFPELETDRLLLKEMTVADYSSDFFEMRREPSVAEHNAFNPYENIKQAEEAISSFREEFEKKEEIFWGVVLKENGKLIGYVRNGFLSDVMSSLGYGLNKYYWGKGHATEAVSAIIDFIYENTETNRIQATVTLKNHPSIKLLERLNFKREGILRERVRWKGAIKDLYMYSLIKSEWKS